MSPTAPDNKRSTDPKSRAAAQRPGNRVPSNLLALGSAAVLAVFAVGYERTRSAANRIAEASDDRRRPPIQVAADTENTSAAIKVQVEDSAALHVKDTLPAALAHDQAQSVSGKTAGMRLKDSAVASAKADTLPTKKLAIATSTDSAVHASVTPPDSAHDAAKTASDTVARAQWHDGTFSGWGTSRHGDIEATVVIANGRIASAVISRCLTRYSCSWVEHLQQQVVARQSPEVDFVSGATQSANAFYYAVVDALQKAK